MKDTAERCRIREARELYQKPPSLVNMVQVSGCMLATSAEPCVISRKPIKRECMGISDEVLTHSQTLYFSMTWENASRPETVLASRF